MKQEGEKKILLDSDVVRHFIKGRALLLLPKIYQDRLVMTTVVKNELCRSRHLTTTVNNFISLMKIEELDFSEEIEILREFARLKQSGRGDGESAVMAVARYRKDIVASSNLKDIFDYCKQHQIEYLTTMDILLDAEKYKIMTEKDCDEFIEKVLEGGSKLPCKTLKEYKEKYKR